MQCLHNIQFGMLQVRDNEISLRKWPGGTAICAPQREQWLQHKPVFLTACCSFLRTLSMISSITKYIMKASNQVICASHSLSFLLSRYALWIWMFPVWWNHTYFWPFFSSIFLLHMCHMLRSTTFSKAFHIYI